MDYLLCTKVQRPLMDVDLGLRDADYLFIWNQPRMHAPASDEQLTITLINGLWRSDLNLCARRAEDGLRDAGRSGMRGNSHHPNKNSKSERVRGRHGDPPPPFPNEGKRRTRHRRAQHELHVLPTLKSHDEVLRCVLANRDAVRRYPERLEQVLPDHLR